MTSLWLALFRCLRKHQLPTHLRPTISVEQLLSFLCHNNSHSVDTDCQASQDQPHKAISLSYFLPTLSLSHLVLDLGMHAKRQSTFFSLYAACQTSFPSWSKPDIKATLIHFHQSAIGWKQYFIFNCLLTPCSNQAGNCPLGNPGQRNINDRGGTINESR